MEMEEDYSELEGNIVIYTSSTDSEIIVSAKVIGCDFNVGLTIIQVDDNGDPIIITKDGVDNNGDPTIINEEVYLTCFNGKSSPLYIETVREKNMTKDDYDKFYTGQFKCAINMIKEGIFDIDELVLAAKKTHPDINWGFNDNIDSKNCPFNQ